MSTNARSSRRWLTIAVSLALACGALIAPAALAAPGDSSQDNIDAAIDNGVAYLATLQQDDGSWNQLGVPEAETGLAVVSYGVADGSDHHLSAERRAEFEKAVDYLLSKQLGDGSWNAGLSNYSTGIVLLALSYAKGLQSPTRDVNGAIAKGRDWSIKHQNAPPSVTGNPGTPDCSTTWRAQNPDYWCGGWGYTEGDLGSWSDTSNTGFALTGLAATGGVPKASADFNLGWQRNIQMLNTNPYTTDPNGSKRTGNQPANDGGGSYYPFSLTGDFSSNANDTGSLLFGYGYDGVPGNDPGVMAAVRFGNAVLDVYGLLKDNPSRPRTMIFHNAADFEVACDPDDAGCNWARGGAGEGGYHYSLFALSKGLGQYAPAQRDAGTNFYAKVVDLLLTQQGTDGSWPVDGRDDGGVVGATAFAVMSLGRVGQPGTVSGTVYDDANGNGRRDVGEGGLGGWIAYADLDDDGVLDSGEPNAQTDGSGAYQIQNLPERSGTIRQVTKPGFVCTAPSGCAYGNVEFTLGQDRAGLDFGDRVPPAPAASAVKGATACGSARRLTIKLRIQKELRRLGIRPASLKKVKSVRVVVNGKRVRAFKRNGRWVARVNLSGLKKGRYTVRIRVTLRSGKVLRGTRRYRTCTAPRKHGPPPL